MTSNNTMDAGLRARLIAQPETILQDRDLMRALITGKEADVAGNVVDLRSVAMDRLEMRLDRLEETHRHVIAAAYENLAGTNQVHRAILRMLDPADFGSFLSNLDDEVAAILRVDQVRLVLEVAANHEFDLGPENQALLLAQPRFIQSYLRGAPDVTLRPVQDLRVYGDGSGLGSEACMLLDLGPGMMPAMLLIGAKDPQHYTPSHGTDLLKFFAGVFERSLRRWLA